MIDRAALETVVVKHAGEMAADSLTLEIHLFSGEIYCVSEIAEYFDAYFVALVYPKELLSEDTLKELIPSDECGRPIFDRVVIPYRTVSYALLTAREPKRGSKLGFTT
jgi:hypothetical protein